ncbi:Putative phage repressor protein phage associated protein [Neisseria gonorrhoeae]|nr:Putative phage repressor protein phage associated protein [Neisseria gonorrhoeae]
MTNRDLKAIRIDNLKRFFENKKLPVKDKSLLSQLMSGKASFGEKVSRRLEEEYGMGSLYLDSVSERTNARPHQPRPAARSQRHPPPDDVEQQRPAARR